MIWQKLPDIPMTRISDILEELESTAGDMLRIPAAFVPRFVLEALHADIIGAIERPAEGERIIDEAHEFLARCLVNACVGVGCGRWIRGARAMLDFIQSEGDLKRAREEELRQLRDGR